MEFSVRKHQSSVLAVIFISFGYRGIRVPHHEPDGLPEKGKEILGGCRHATARARAAKQSTLVIMVPFLLLPWVPAWVIYLAAINKV
jgi:hypothetical protein